MSHDKFNYLSSNFFPLIVDEAYTRTSIAKNEFIKASPTPRSQSSFIWRGYAAFNFRPIFKLILKRINTLTCKILPIFKRLAFVIRRKLLILIPHNRYNMINESNMFQETHIHTPPLQSLELFSSRNALPVSCTYFRKYT